MPVINHVNTAKMPFGILLKEIIALEGKGLGGVSAMALDDALDIQRDLIVLEIIRSDVAANGRLKQMVREDKLEKIVNMPIARMIAPPGRALDRFRREFLADPEAKLDGILSQARYMQDENIVPETIPPIGTIYCSAQTGLGKDGGALINHLGFSGGLMVQTCCRCMLNPMDRDAFTPMRIMDADQQPLQDAQLLFNKLLLEKRQHNFAEGEKIGKWLTAAVVWLYDAGFSAYAFTLKEFVEDSKAPFKPSKISV